VEFRDADLKLSISIEPKSSVTSVKFCSLRLTLIAAEAAPTDDLPHVKLAGQVIKAKSSFSASTVLPDSSTESYLRLKDMAVLFVVRLTVCCGLVGNCDLM
jgi:hypothetical protein